jgi:hypothetical protein
MANSNALRIARYFEKVLGLSKVEAGFFIQDPPVSSPPTAAAPIKCWLIDSSLIDSSLIDSSLIDSSNGDSFSIDSPSALPSIQEMASKLKSAIEAEWVKHGRSGQVMVEWLTGEAYKRSGNVGYELGLVIFFGEQSVSRREHLAYSLGVLMPRLDEMNLNPSLKRDAWRKIQSEIARFSAEIGAS